MIIVVDINPGFLPDTNGQDTVLAWCRMYPPTQNTVLRVPVSYTQANCVAQRADGMLLWREELPRQRYERGTPAHLEWLRVKEAERVLQKEVEVAGCIWAPHDLLEYREVLRVLQRERP